MEEMEADQSWVVDELLECTKAAIELDSDDSDKDEIVLGLLDLCEDAATVHRPWIMPWRQQRKESGSLGFLYKQIQPEDGTTYEDYLGVNKYQFDLLLTLVRPDVERTTTCLRAAISAAEKLAITLRFLTTGDSYKNLNCETGISSSIISHSVPEVCASLYKNMKDAYLKLPTNTIDWEAAAIEFTDKWQFPNCIGALGERRVKLRSIRNDDTAKAQNSMLMVALADAKYRFTFVDIDCSGANANTQPDADNQCPLAEILSENKNMPLDAIVGKGRLLPHVMIASAAFPLHMRIMKPYPHSTTSKREAVFNMRLARARHVIDFAFDMLVSKFRVLQTIMHVKVEYVREIAYACCVLHNFLVDSDEAYASRFDCTSTENAISSELHPIDPRLCGGNARDAEYIRQEFMMYFNEEGRQMLEEQNITFDIEYDLCI